MPILPLLGPVKPLKAGLMIVRVQSTKFQFKAVDVQKDDAYQDLLTGSLSFFSVALHFLFPL